MRLPTLTLLMVLGLATCTKSPAPKAQPGTLSPVELPPEHPAVTPLPDPELNAGHTGRAPRRHHRRPSSNVSRFRSPRRAASGAQLDALAPSLGQADYAVTSSESTEANLVFAKFLDDGAREVCLNAAASADLARTDPVTRVLFPDVTAPTATSPRSTTLPCKPNLSHPRPALLGLRPSSRRRAGPPGRAPSRTLAARAKDHEQARARLGRASASRLMTDPRFFTY
jgi:hypothetical protein